MGEQDDLIGQVLAGRYRIERLIQRGGMGAVYEAVQEPLGRRVAIKVLHAHLASDEVTLSRFRREAEATARLNHPHIVQVSDYQAQPGEPAILVMEYLTGRSLADVMREDGVFPQERAVHVAIQVLDGLGAAHAEGIVHRDLKPTNVILGSTAGLRDVVTILDFGIAKLLEAAGTERSGRLTVEGTLVGTPAYMAPEQARGGEIDARADLYALGVLLYAMLAGRLPYDARDPGAILRAIIDGQPTSLVSARPDLDPELIAAVDKALAKDPDARWQTAEEMRRALQQWQRRAGLGAGELAGAKEPVGTERGRRIWPVAVALVGAAVLGALLTYALRPVSERVVVVPAASSPDAVVEAPAPIVAPSPTSVDAAPAIEPPRVIPRPSARSLERDAGPRLRVQAAAPARLYAQSALSEKLGSLGSELGSCADGQDIPEGSAPPVWYLDVTATGDVQAVRTAMGEWPIAAANCVTRALTTLELGPTANGEGGRVVVTVAR